MTNDQFTQNELVPDGGAYNVIAVSFEEDNNAYKALTVLKELDSEGRIGLQEGVVAERGDDGQVVEKDETESEALVGTASGGLVGLLVGIIGGPVGMLIGGSTGLLVGSMFDLADYDETDSALAGISGAVKVGHTALLAVVSERSPEVVDSSMAELGGTVLRRSVADVEVEVAAAEDAARKAKREARKELVKAHHEKNKAAINAKVDALKTKVHRGKKTPA